MKLIERIKQDRIFFFKERQRIKSNLLGCLIADSQKTTKEPSDDIVFALIKKYIENCQLVIEKSEVGSSSFFQASMEIDILESYQPEQLTEPEIRNVISTLRFQGKNFSEVMGHFKNVFPNRYNGKLVSTIAKEMI